MASGLYVHQFMRFGDEPKLKKIWSTWCVSTPWALGPPGFSGVYLFDVVLPDDDQIRALATRHLRRKDHARVVDRDAHNLYIALPRHICRKRRRAFLNAVQRVTIQVM